MDKKTKMKEKKASGIWKKVLGICLAAVSYTHLDVYKRQILFHITPLFRFYYHTCTFPYVFSISSLI